MRFFFALLLCGVAFAQHPPRSAEYDAVQNRLARGWNTWDVHSVAEQVLLPDGLAIKFGVQHRSTLTGETFLSDALIGRLGAADEQVFPGPHSWDGSYSEFRLTWRSHEMRVQSAHDGVDVVVLVTPIQSKGAVPPVGVFSVSFLWNRPGTVSRRPDSITAESRGRTVSVYFAGKAADYKQTSGAGAYYSADLSLPAAIATGHQRSIDEIRDIIDRVEHTYRSGLANDPVAAAIETTLGWDTIYDPDASRVISPVSRLWSTNWGGWVLFDWDTFFAASLAGIGDRDLAYANALEILREETPKHFVPNYARAGDWKSNDRSEPPVGAITVRDLYNRFHDLWFIRDAFEPLLAWNRWWASDRDLNGYLVWGSDGANEPQDVDDGSRGKRQGAIYESGLDNSPMYDDAVYDEKSHKLLIADVGLMGMFIADCDALAEMAHALGRSAEESELKSRAAKYRQSLATLWDEKTGMFLNKDLHTGELSHRVSPTNFYPMLARAATPEQARRMVQEHLLNPGEFWGDYVIPAISRNDPGFKDQNYWRGRIWGPMNYLVYLGLRNYDVPDVRAQFAAKSLNLFLKNWREKGQVCENYNAILGVCDDVRSSDRFYHWGALLGLIDYIEKQPSTRPQ